MNIRRVPQNRSTRCAHALSNRIRLDPGYFAFDRKGGKQVFRTCSRYLSTCTLSKDIAVLGNENYLGSSIPTEYYRHGLSLAEMFSPAVARSCERKTNLFCAIHLQSRRPMGIIWHELKYLCENRNLPN